MSNIGGQFYGKMARDRQITSVDEAIADAVRAADYILVLTALTAVLVMLKIFFAGKGLDDVGGLVLLALVGVSLRRYRSRFLAIGLLIHAAFGFLVFLVWLLFTHTGPMPSSGVIMLLLSVKAVRATFAAAAAERIRLRWKGVAINSALCLVYLAIFYGIVAFVCIWADVSIEVDPPNATLLVVTNIVFLGSFAIIALVGLQLLPFTRRVVNWIEPVHEQSQNMAPEAAPSAG
jgi:hypothetical protein